MMDRHPTTNHRRGSAPVRQVDWRKELMNLPYYHPSLSDMPQVLQALQAHGKINGSFLFRNSFSDREAFTVSIVHNGGVKHFKVLPDRSCGCYVLPDKRFPSAAAIVDYYSRNDVTNDEKIPGIRLTGPVEDQTRMVALGRAVSDSRLRSTLPPLPGAGAARVEVFERVARPPGDNWRARVDVTNLRNSSTNGNTVAENVQISRSGSVVQYAMSSKSGITGDEMSNSGNTVRQMSGNDRTVNRSSGNDKPACRISPDVAVQNVTSETNETLLKTLHYSDDAREMPRVGDSAFTVLPSDEDSGEGSSCDSCGTQTANNTYRTGGVSRRCYTPLPSVSSPYYSEARDTGIENLPFLIEHLVASDMCECGLSFSESEFDNGWTVHLSHLDGSNSNQPLPPIFFMSPDGYSTWEIPAEAFETLTDDEKSRLKMLQRRRNIDRRIQAETLREIQ